MRSRITILSNGIVLVPPNLATLGVPRFGNGEDADLITIWNTPYPVITNFKEFCKVVGWYPLGGGTVKRQAKKIKGYINSGYRDMPIGGNEISEHMWATALDSIAGDAKEQLEVVPKACAFFNRVGLYPERGFMHLGLAPDEWIRKYNKAKYWIKTNKYKFFSNPADMISYLKAEYGI